MFFTIKLCTHAKLNCFCIKMDLVLNNLQRLICQPTISTLLKLFKKISKPTFLSKNFFRRLTKVETS